MATAASLAVAVAVAAAMMVAGVASRCHVGDSPPAVATADFIGETRAPAPGDAPN